MGGEMRPLAARINPTKKRFLFTGPSVAQENHARPSTNCHQRLVPLIGWSCLSGAALGADEREGGHAREQTCGALQRGPAVLALYAK